MNSKRLVTQFIDLVKIDSQTKNELNICNYLFKILEDFDIALTKNKIGHLIDSNGYNIIARIPGTLKSTPILLSAHVDTVSPGNNINPIIKDDLITSDGTTILGSDDKSGIAIILEAIKTIFENKIEHRDIEIVFSIYEEGGLKGAKHLNPELISATHALVFDSGGEIGTLINQAPAQKNIDFKIIGKPAHAGVAPEEGISAILVLSDIISHMKLGRINEKTTANIGFVNGGVAKNIVMPEISVIAEARSLDNDELTSQIEHMKQTIEKISKKYNADSEIEVFKSYSAYHIPENDEFIQEVIQTFKDLNITSTVESSGGGSDANIYNELGIKTLNLSTGMTNVHTLQECIKISDMEKATKFLIEFLTK